MKGAKYGIGDKVEVVNYGAILSTEEGEIDIMPTLLGQQGLISKVTKTQGLFEYSIDGIPLKIAWYNENQLKMVNKNR